ncbi:hypothetical protein ACFL2V_12820 [Pseudomonadota bacterium]
MKNNKLPLKQLSKGLLLAGVMSASSSAFATPTYDVQMEHQTNGSGGYTYTFSIENLGPVSGQTTFGGYSVTDYSDFTVYDASNKSLDQDNNIVRFGIDTGRDDVVITNIADALSFDGEELPDYLSFTDSDNDGIKNQNLAWALPNFFTMGQTLDVGDILNSISFDVDELITDFTFWAVGSDDNYIWNENHTMLVDGFGIFDATDGEYLATTMEKQVTSVPVAPTSLLLSLGLFGLAYSRRNKNTVS